MINELNFKNKIKEDWINAFNRVGFITNNLNFV